MSSAEQPNDFWGLRQRFNSGCSLAIVIIILVVGLIVVVVVGQGDNPGTMCLVEFSGDLQKDHPLWARYVDTYRGDDYYAVKMRDGDTPEQIQELKKTAKMCPVTLWAGLHFFMYLLLGFLCPLLFWPLFLFSIVWELYETFIDCHCMLDLLWNFSGLFLGVYLRQKIAPVSDMGMPWAIPIH